jgi:catechol 2,3-dioxygenase-like lactoylglutathione lyase family enzyme
MRNLDKIDHIAIQVNDIEKSLEWYTKNFKCNKIYFDNSWAFIEFDNVKLALVSKDEHPNHFAILDQKLLKDDKVVEHRDGSRSKYIKDINGNYIELIKY